MTASRFLCICLVATGFTVCGCASTKQQPSGVSSEYKRLLELQKQKTAASVATTEPTAKQKPEFDAAGHERRGDQYVRQGNAVMALVEYEKCLGLDPASVGARYKEGRLLVQQGLIAEGLREFDEILKQDPVNAFAFFGQGLAFLRNDQPDAAEEKLRRASDLDPALWEAHVYLGVIYDRKKQFSAAVDEYDKALAVNPSSASILNNRGVSCWLNGDYKRSIQSFVAALRIDPTNNRISNNLGLAYAAAGKPDEAFEAFRRGGNEAGARNNIGYVHMIQGNYEKAAKAFGEAMEASPNFYVKAQENSDRLQALARAGGSEAP